MTQRSTRVERQRVRTEAPASEEIERLRTQLRESRAVLHGELEVYRAELQTANDELRQTAQQLEASRDRYAELYDLAPVAYLTLDAAGAITELNLPAATLLDRPRSELLGRPLLVFALKEHRSLILQHVRRCGREDGPIVTELLLKQPRGAPLPVELSSRRRPKSGQEGAQFFTVIVDLTERKRTEEALRRSERLAGLGTLTAGLAHEIKSPLQAILLSAQLLSHDLPPEKSESLQKITEDVRRCDRIVKNMLLFAREEPTEKWPADLNVLIRRAIGVARGCGYMCEIVLRLADRPVPIQANPTEIEQVMLNLIQNAAEASAGHCRMEITTRANGKRAVLVVEDNGPGIAREHLAHLFDPFFTTRRGRGGTGLGLSVVHGIVTGHQGTIQAESGPGRGARFVIDFPLTRSVAGGPN